MRPIDKFILHVVHNWKNKLNEAYSESAIKKFIEQFREEADDLNIQITDEQLRKYIERFDAIKNSPKIPEKDLGKWSLGALIRLITASKGAETPDDDEDRTPDVVYQDGGITIWNGSKEDNCITYGRGERWCITRGSFGNYRYDSSKGYPTFYLAKNTNLSDSDKLSFVAIQVRDVNNENNRYVYTNRQNSPYESSPMGFSKLMSEIPWLRDIPNIQSILKYIPLSNKEKLTQTYKNEAASIREWIKMPFETKKQYLVVRKNKNFFEDISILVFVSKYLPQYPQIAEFIAVTPGIINPVELLSNLDKFNNQDRRSITANIQTPIALDYLGTDRLSFDVKKLLVALKKWNTGTTDRLYITKDGSTIVRLKLDDNISVGLYQAEDDYPNIKLNQRTSKYLLDYPELDKIPFNNMIKLVADGILDKSIIDKIIEKAKTEEDSAIVVKDIDGKEILLDSNSFASYKIEGNKITKVPFTDEDVQKAFAEEKDNTSFQDNAINTVKASILTGERIPPSIDKEAFVSIIKATPYNKRTLAGNRDNSIILIPDGESDKVIFTQPTNPYDKLFYNEYDFGRSSDWRIRDNSNPLKEGDFRAYFAWMRNENKVYDSEQLIRKWRDIYSTTQPKKDWFRAQPPFSPTDRYAPVVSGDAYYLVNKANPRESLKLSDTGKLVKANISPIQARQLVGATPDEATPTAPAAQAQPAVPVAGAPRRGRPAGVQNVRAPQPAAPAAPDAGGDINVPEVMDETGLNDSFLRLPRADYRRLAVTTGVRVNPNGDRGAARRNNQLGNAGRVGRVIAVGDSKIYFIRLANQQIIASINIQPGNRNYLLFGNEQGNVMVPMNSPSELMQVLQQRNLAEVRNYIIREYVANNPQHLDEVREMLRRHINETRNR